MPSLFFLVRLLACGVLLWAPDDRPGRVVVYIYTVALIILAVRVVCSWSQWLLSFIV